MKKNLALLLFIIVCGCAASKEPSADKALYVIDGKISSKSQADKLTKEQLSSISVLKGKAATSLYGEKGKKGVVLITTKK